MSYHINPPTLAGNESDPAFDVTFLYLGHRDFASTPAVKSPELGSVGFVSTLSGDATQQGISRRGLCEGVGKLGDAPYSADPDDITAQIDLIGVPG